MCPLHIYFRTQYMPTRKNRDFRQSAMALYTYLTLSLHDIPSMPHRKCAHFTDAKNCSADWERRYLVCHDWYVYGLFYRTWVIILAHLLWHEQCQKPRCSTLWSTVLRLRETCLVNSTERSEVNGHKCGQEISIIL